VTQPLWSHRFFTSTRGQIVARLRRASQTVDELARALDLTDNAVRAQLAGLERDGIVRHEGRRKGTGKPSVAYALSPDVESLLSRAYQPLLDALLETLTERLSERELTAVLRGAGRALAGTLPIQRGDVATRAKAAAAILNDLGGLAAAEPGPDHWEIRSEGCPLSALVAHHPKACKAVEAMVGELVGGTVRERCDRSGDRPRCRFELVGSS
jgi:predicted ArsR family transcriptional regulator